MNQTNKVDKSPPGRWGGMEGAHTADNHMTSAVSTNVKSHPWRSTHTLADSTSRVLLTFSLISSRGKGPLHLEPPPCQKTLPLDGPHTHRWKLNALWTFPFRAEQRRLKRTNSNHKCKKKGWKTDLYLQNTSEIKQLACGDTPVNHGLHTEDFL